MKNTTVVQGWGKVLQQSEIDVLFGGIRRQAALGKRVLVTDDAPFMRTHVRELLQESGYEVVGEAGSGREAVDVVVKLRPDIVIMDIVMPELDGIDALRQIKQIDPNISVMLCSSMASQQIVTSAIDAGASWFIVKPFLPGQFIARLKRL